VVQSERSLENNKKEKKNFGAGEGKKVHEGRKVCTSEHTSTKKKIFGSQGVDDFKGNYKRLFEIVTDSWGKYSCGDILRIVRYPAIQEKLPFRRKGAA